MARVGDIEHLDPACVVGNVGVVARHNNAVVRTGRVVDTAERGRSGVGDVERVVTLARVGNVGVVARDIYAGRVGAAGVGADYRRHHRIADIEDKCFAVCLVDDIEVLARHSEPVRIAADIGRGGEQGVRRVGNVDDTNFAGSKVGGVGILTRECNTIDITH